MREFFTGGVWSVPLTSMLLKGHLYCLMALLPLTHGFYLIAQDECLCSSHHVPYLAIRTEMKGKVVLFKGVAQKLHMSLSLNISWAWTYSCFAK